MTDSERIAALEARVAELEGRGESKVSSPRYDRQAQEGRNAAFEALVTWCQSRPAYLQDYRRNEMEAFSAAEIMHMTGGTKPEAA